jgi:hypothetical protein
MGGGSYVNEWLIYIGGKAGATGLDGEPGSFGGDGGLGGRGGVHWAQDGEEPDPDRDPGTQQGGDAGPLTQAGEDGVDGGGGGGGGGSSFPYYGGPGGAGGDGPAGLPGEGGTGDDGEPESLVTTTSGTNTDVITIGGGGGQGGGGGGGGTGGGGGGGAGDCNFLWGYGGAGGYRGSAGPGGDGGAGGDGAIFIRSGGHLENAHNLWIGWEEAGVGRSGDAQLRVESGGIFTNHELVVVGSVGEGDVAVADGGLVQNLSAATIDVYANDLGGAGVSVQDGGVLQNWGEMNLYAGATMGLAGHFATYHPGQFTVDADAFLGIQPGATFECGGFVTLNTVYNYGIISGGYPGAFAIHTSHRLWNSGLLSPGTPAQPINTLVFAGDVLIGDTRIEVGYGNDVVGQWGAGSAELTMGTVHVAFAAGFSEANLSPGAYYDFMRYESRVGVFAGIDDSEAPLTRGYWELSYDHISGDYHSCRLTYVHDPSSVGPSATLPREFAFRAARPNPCHSHTTLAYDLPRPANVRLCVCDVAGRVVRTLRAGELEGPGRFTVTWSGRSDSGARVPSGIYWLRFVAGEFTQTQRLIVLE